jgi:hypothetical protein
VTKTPLQDLQLKYEALAEITRKEIAKREIAEALVRTVYSNRDDVWFWMGNGEDHLENLTCPVVMRAETLQGILDKHAEFHRRAQKVEGEAAQLPKLKERNERYMGVIRDYYSRKTAYWRRRYEQARQYRSWFSKFLTIGFGLEDLRIRLLKAELRAEKAERVVDCYLNQAHCFGVPCQVCGLCVALKDYAEEEKK